MLIAIDYDGTYDEDPAVWDVALGVMAVAGHDVIMVTGRMEEHKVPESVENGRDIYYTNHQSKRKYMREVYGLEPHVWIDDRPESMLFDWDAESQTISNGQFNWEVREND